MRPKLVCNVTKIVMNVQKSQITVHHVIVLQDYILKILNALQIVDKVFNFNYLYMKYNFVSIGQKENLSIT
jgi:hypothetical protein